MDAKLELWESTVSLTLQILKEAEQLGENKEGIFNHAWWERTRYLKIGKQMGDKLNNNVKLK